MGGLNMVNINIAAPSKKSAVPASASNTLPKISK